jgi:hypothetical protein
MIAFCFDVGIGDLIVEKLRGLRRAGNTQVFIIQQAAQKRELPLPIQDLASRMNERDGCVWQVMQLTSSRFLILLLMLDFGSFGAFSCCRQAFKASSLNKAFDLIEVARLCFKEDCRKRDRPKQCSRSGRR